MLVEFHNAGTAIVALAAGERLVACVRPLVLAEITAIGAAIFALGTAKRLFTRTTVAGKRLLARVCHLMEAEIAGPNATVATLVAREQSSLLDSHSGAFGRRVGGR